MNPGYTVMSLGVDVRAHELITLYLRGENVADESYESVLGYPAMPRSVVAGVRFHFGGRP